MSGFEQDRVTKISQIMPQFCKVANTGDTVLMGLEGDPLYPSDFKSSRPSATITNVSHRKNDSLVSLKMPDGSIKEVSSMTLAADQVWEFDDASFRNVMERQQKKHAPTQPEYRGVDDFNSLKKEISQLRNELNDAKYRGSNDMIKEMKTEMNSMKEQLNAEKIASKNFQNTIIESMNQMAADVCNVNPNAEFCQVLNKEYSKLTHVKSPVNMSHDAAEMSADDTDFF